MVENEEADADRLARERDIPAIARERDIPDSVESRTAIRMGGSRDSEVDGEGDVDWFRARLVAGHSYQIDLQPRPGAAEPLADPYFHGIHDGDGRLLPGTENDDFGDDLASRVTFQATTTGIYFLAAGGYGSGGGAYRLSLQDLGRPGGGRDAIADDAATTGRIAVGAAIDGVIDTPRDVDWYRVDLVAGTHYRIRLQGVDSGLGTLPDPQLVGVYDALGRILPGSGSDDSPGSNDSLLDLTPLASGSYFLAAGGHFNDVGTYQLSVARIDRGQDVPGDATSTARIAVGGRLMGEIEQPGDVDWIRVRLTAGATYTIREQGEPSEHGTLGDPLIAGIYSGRGVVVPGSSNDDAEGLRDSLVTFTAPRSGDFFIAASAFGDNVGTYRLWVQQAPPDLAAPRLLATSPAGGGTVAAETEITLAFDEAVRAGSGTIRIEGGGEVRTIAIGDRSQVRFQGETVTIDPERDLRADTDYRITLDPGAVTDIARNHHAGIGEAEAIRLHTGPAAAQDSWTVMVYMAADNNLESFALRDLQEMEAGLGAHRDRYNVVTMVDRAPGYADELGDWTDTRQGPIRFDRDPDRLVSPLVSQGELDTGDPATLTRFIDWAASARPAEHYALILWDHGDGLGGMCWDDTSGNNLSIAEITRAIQRSDLGRLDLVGFDACLQGLAEQAFELRCRADVIVASEELEPGDGWAYDRWLARLDRHPDMTGLGLAQAIVQSYGEEYAGQSDITLAATRVQALGTLGIRLDRFVDRALQPTTDEADWQAMRVAAARAVPFPSDDSDPYADLGDFMGEVGARVADPQLARLARLVQAGVDDTVLARTGSVGEASGISIYLPHGNERIDPTYTAENYRFLKAVDWDEYLAML